MIVLAAAVQAQQYTKATIYNFKGSPDGTEPLFSGVARDANGNFYGTTYSGGAYHQGMVFKISPDGKETVLHSFRGADGSLPDAGVVLDSAGNLYGTTSQGGTRAAQCNKGCGVVYKVDPFGNETVVYRFHGGVDGGFPVAGVIRDSVGNLYGTTQIGGAQSLGAVYKVDNSGNETVLHSFAGGNDGAFPFACLIRDGAGNFYGTTTEGGPSNTGTVFKLDPSGNETVLYSFGPTSGSDAQGPRSPVYRDAAGNLYGTSFFGGTRLGGAVYKIDANGHETVLHSFDGNDGLYPESPLIADAQGDLYGTTIQGGPAGNNGGVVFKITPDGALTAIYQFLGGNDGQNPAAGLLKGAGRKLIGTASMGGTSNNGTVYELVP
jgi:uncharacterized repeat protein (TIGR03803 family)